MPDDPAGMMACARDDLPDELKFLGQSAGNAGWSDVEAAGFDTG